MDINEILKRMENLKNMPVSFFDFPVDGKHIAGAIILDDEHQELPEL